MTQYLLNAARTFVFSTAPPPPAVAGALAALELLEERPRLVDKLQRRTRPRSATDSTPRASTSAARAPTSCRSSVGEPELALEHVRGARSRAACSPRRSRRRAVPAADLAAAPGRDGLPPPPRSCAPPHACSRRPRAPSGSTRGHTSSFVEPRTPSRSRSSAVEPVTPTTTMSTPRRTTASRSPTRRSTPGNGSHSTATAAPFDGERIARAA